MKEIDDRYPEYARPYEPVKGGRHHGRLTGNEGNMMLLRRVRHLDRARRGFLMGVGILILLTVLIGPLNPDRQTPVPEPTPEVIPVPEPEPVIPPDEPVIPPEEPVIPPDEPVIPPDEPVIPPDEPIIPPDEPIPVPDPEPIPPPDDPTPPPEEPEPEPLTDPAFTKLNMEREHDEGVASRPVDLFRYAFELDLNDADTDKPVTVWLQYGNSGGSGWTDCASEGYTVNTLTYAGEGAVWNGELAYDLVPVDTGDAGGILRQMRIVCGYTLTDGTAGTVYSTDCGILYAYKGQYLRGESAELSGEKLTAVFRVDKELVLDTGKLTVQGVNLRSADSGTWNLKEKADVSPVAEDGTVTVTYILNGESLNTDASNVLELELLYEDRGGAIRDWVSDARISFSAPYIPHAPAFTELGVERSYNPGVDEEYWELFWYGFSLDLNDADISRDVTVRLEYLDKNSGMWTECPEEGETVSRLIYDGEENVWSGELIYDVLDLELESEELGRLWQVRIACDYTLIDGTDGTVYSTDCRTLYAYKGEYLRGISAELKGGVLTAVYQVDLLMVQETGEDNLAVTELTLWSGNGYGDNWDLEGKAEVSPVGEDGTITVTYTLDGEELDPAKENRLGMELTYNNSDGTITGWNSYDSISFKIPPVVDLDPHVYGPDAEGAPYPVLSFDMTLNSLKGGTAVGTFYMDTGSGFEKVPLNPEYEDYTGTVEYNGEDVEDDIWTDRAEYLVDPPEGGGFAARAKIVFDIVYPDGTSDVIETETRPIHMGHFARINNGYGHNGWDVGEVHDEETGSTRYTMSFDVIIDKALVDPERVTEEGSEIWLEDPWSYYRDSRVETVEDEDGTYHWVYTFFSDEPFPDGEYWFDPVILYEEDDYNYWVNYNFYLHFIKDMEGQHNAPQIRILREEMENDSTGYVPAEIQLNDLKGGSATAVLYRQNEDGIFEPLEDEWAAAVYDPSEEPGETWTIRLYDRYLEEYDGIGARDRVKIVLKYTYPDREEGSREADLYLYAGEYAWFTPTAVPVYEPDTGTGAVTAELIVEDALADADEIYVREAHIVRDDSGEEEGNLYSYIESTTDLGNGTHLAKVLSYTGQLEPGEYTLDIELACWDEFGGCWNIRLRTGFTIT